MLSQAPTTEHHILCDDVLGFVALGGSESHPNEASREATIAI